MQLKAARFPPVLTDVHITLYNCLINSVICRMKYSGSGSEVLHPESLSELFLTKAAATSIVSPTSSPKKVGSDTHCRTPALPLFQAQWAPKPQQILFERT